MEAEEYFKEWSQNCRLIEVKDLKHTYQELIDFAESYHKAKNSNQKVVFNFPPIKVNQ